MGIRASKAGQRCPAGPRGAEPRQADATRDQVRASRKLPKSNTGGSRAGGVANAAASRGATRSTCHGRAPPRPQEAAIVSASSAAGGVQHSRRRRSGWSRFSAGTYRYASDSAVTTSRAAASARPRPGRSPPTRAAEAGASLLGPRTEGSYASGSARPRSIAAATGRRDGACPCRRRRAGR